MAPCNARRILARVDCEVWDGTPFKGAKAILLNAGRLVVLRRDDIPTIPWPDRIDLPGGARDPGEDPITCALREVQEEVGLEIAPSRVIWARQHPSPSGPLWMLAAQITTEEAGALRLGDEGQACWMMDVGAYLAAEDAIPRQQARVAEVLSRLGDRASPG